MYGCLNGELSHFGLEFGNYVTPSERHNGKDEEILKRRAEVLLAAKQLNPKRWPRDVRNCKPVGDVHLNPEREAA